MKRPSIIFRADGHTKMGLGHVVRSLALAEMLKEEFDCHFIIRNPSPSLSGQIQSTCKTLTEIPETDDDLAEAQMLVDLHLSAAQIVVLDGYHFKTAYQQTIKKSGCVLVCIDDIYAFHFVSDVVINHAPGLKASVYSTEKQTQVCLGLDYSLLRKPFQEAAMRNQSIRGSDTLFICFGGADFNNITMRALQAIASQPGPIKKINLVVGGANSYLKGIKEFVGSNKNVSVNLHQNLNAQEMCKIMDQSDLAIVPSSSILYEITAVKIPVISGYYVDNQINIYRGFRDLGMIYGIGDFNDFENYSAVITDLTKPDSVKMLESQQQYQNGYSKDNYLSLFRSLAEN